VRVIPRVLAVVLLVVSTTTYAVFPKPTVWLTCNLGSCGSLFPNFATPIEACYNSFANNPSVTNIRVDPLPNPVGNHECYANFPGCGDPNGCGTGVSAGPRQLCPIYSSSGTSDCTCSSGFLQANSTCSGGKNNSCSVTSILLGNPCNAANGNKLEREVVYRGLNGFEFALTYNSFDTRWTRFGDHWRDTFDRSILMDGANAVVYRQDGRVLVYTPNSGVWTTDADTNDHLVELQSPPGTRIGWELTVAATDELESYNAAGKLISIRSRSGLLQTLTYSDGTSGPNGGVIHNPDGSATTTPLPAGVLIRVSDHFGRTLSFVHNAALHPLRMTDPAGGVYRFGYITGQPLKTITYPDNKVRTFVYSEVANTSGAFIPGVLTGIVDENGDRFATFQYDTQRRSITTEHAGPSMRYSFSFGTGATTVTDPLNTQRTYNFQTVLSAFKNTGITGPVCPSCGPKLQTFDANGSVASTTDWNNNKTTYVYDLARNLESSRTEALTSSGASTPQTRTISTEWHPTFRLPTKVAEPLRLTTFVYDANGSQCGARGALCTKTMQATTDANGSEGLTPTVTGLPRTWTYTYNANGHVVTVNGPRTDVSDTATYTYYANNHADLGKRGNVATISNALGHLTTITEYNSHGQPLTIVDANSMTTTLTYDERQRLKTRNADGELTSYDYDGVGQITRITLPDGSYLNYDYDAAHRVTEISDNLGNKIVYTLDAMGNRTLDQVSDPSNQLVQKRSRVYSTLNRLFRELGAENPAHITEFGYDDQGNVISVKDPLNHETTSQYDALNRLKQVTAPAPDLGVTKYGYNGLDAVNQVTDPRNLVTGYTVDGLGNVSQQSSPDTGNTTITHDAAGNVLTKTDAAGFARTYTYDALNRIASIGYVDPPGSQQIWEIDTYTYDQGPNSVGRLSSIVRTNVLNDVLHEIHYSYDLHGRITQMRTVYGGAEFLVGYSYDVSGRLSSITYPGGRTVNYGFDALGRVNLVTTTKNSQTQTVVQNVAYHPFGGVRSYTLGNGRAYSRSIDLDGRIKDYTLGGQSFEIRYDAASRIDRIRDVAAPVNAVTYVHDEVNRLTAANDPSTAYAYTYDKVGNRTSRTVGTNTENYTYSPTSNRIAQIGTSTFAYYSNGSTLSDKNNGYDYDAQGRMREVSTTLDFTYLFYNALGQRLAKYVDPTVFDYTIFHYDLGGKLISETTTAGSPKREIIYLGEIPVGVVQ
jgi:YD repeat-containing protein